MWIIEVNFAGRRFTREVYGRRRSVFPFSPRNFSWRSTPLRDPHAA
jgi:hypothetical protein